MKYLTLGQAAKLTGKSKPTISKAIKDRRISAERRPDKSYQIEVSELIRVYPALPETDADSTIQAKSSPASDTSILELEKKHLEEKVDELQKRLDKAEAREDAANKRLDTVLVQLEDQRPKTFWQRLSGK
jgi:excisionase family DNA binding protein